MEPILARLRSEVLVCDGAMGTMLHTAGISLDRSLPELNVSDPALVRSIHESYLAAGAQIIQTNTFAASRVKLRGHGLEDRTRDINRAGALLGRAAIDSGRARAYLAGSVGPVATGALRGRLSASERVASLEEQIGALLEGGVDLLIFETFVDLAELVEGVRVARALGAVPVVAQMTFVEDGRTLSGDEPRDVALTLQHLGVDVVGVNCSLGPQGVLQVLRQLGRHTGLSLSAQPNAGLPKMVAARRFSYRVDGEYFARQALRYVDVGARIVGGCCGTTPEHIAAVARALAGKRLPGPRQIAAGATPSPTPPPVPGPEDGVGLLERLEHGHQMVVVEVSPPAGGDPELAVQDVEAIRLRGADLIAIAAGATARAQMSPIGMALLLGQRVQVETIITVTTWDRNIMALQADLLGAHSCGIRNVICRTGLPPLQGDYPNLDGIWDVDSIGLIRLLHALNEGRDYNGIPTGMPTAFAIGAKLNPGAQDLDSELARARLKIAAGARFLVTEPVFDVSGLERALEGLGRPRPPVLLGLTPLLDFTQAEYLRHEVPDVALPDAVVERIRAAGDDGLRTGLEICRELVLQAGPLISGIMITLPQASIDFTPVLAGLFARGPQAAR